MLTACRKYLGLDITDSDWRVAAVMALVEQDTRLENMLPGFDSSDCDSDAKIGKLNFMGSLWQRPADAWVGGVLAPDALGPPVLLHEPDVWPCGDLWTLTKVNDTNLRISVLHGEWVVPAALGGSTLNVKWPDDIGWRGTIELYGSWSPVSVNHVPVYPVDAVADGLSSRAVVPLILQATGLYDAWNLSANSSEKVSTVATAIIRMASQL